MSGTHDPDKLIAYILNELSADQRTVVEAHIKECAKCREKYEELSLVSTRLTEDIASSAMSEDSASSALSENEDTFLIELNQKIDEQEEVKPGWRALRWLATGGAFVLILMLLARRPGPQPTPVRPQQAAQQSTPKITQLVRKTPAVHPDFSGFLSSKARLEKGFSTFTPGPLPAFPATPKLTNGVRLTFPKIKL